MSILSVQKALRSLDKTPIILNAVLREVSQERAENAFDTPDGWNVLYIVCHMRDFEAIFCERVQLMIEQDHPIFPSVDNERLVRENRYHEQDLRAALATYHARRRDFIHLLQSLDEAQWSRRGTHPVYGDGSVLDVAANAALHDLDHISQIITALKHERIDNGSAATPAKIR